MLEAGRAFAVLVTMLWSAVPIAFVVLSSFKDHREIFVFPPALSHRQQARRRALRQCLISPGRCQQPDRDAGRDGAGERLQPARRLCLCPSSQWHARGVGALHGGDPPGAPIVVTLPLFPLADWLGLNDTYPS
jgi:multiple sugar transport system permease protein